MSLIADVSLSGDLILFGDALEAVPEAVYTLENVHCLVGEGATGDRSASYVFFWWTTGCSAVDAEAALDADPTVESVQGVCHLDDATLHRVDTVPFPASQPLIFPALRSQDATWVSAHRDADGLHVRVRLPDRDALDGFVDAAETVGSNVVVHRLREADGRKSADLSLTDRQRDALALAYEWGYFATPSETNLDALADEFGVTPQTLSRHLRVAVEKVVADALDPATSVLEDPSQ